MNRFLYLCATAFALVLFAPLAAFACTCAGQQPTCEAFGSSRAVFVGKVIGAKQQREQKNEDGTTTTFQIGEIYFSVEQSFLGVKSSRVVIHSGTGGGDCGFWFIKGQRYLVYAYGESMDTLSTNICTRTRGLDDADEDLTFLRTMPRKGAGIRIYGTVTAALKDPKSADRHKPIPLSGVTVKIEGKRTFDAVTNADGEYELTGLPPGRYKIAANLADYYYRGDYWVREIEVADRGCAEASFTALNDSRITGRVLRPDETGLPRAAVELIPVDVDPASVRRMSLDLTFANEKGEFVLAQIPPGRYLLGVNITLSPDKESPFPRTFYPGTSDRSKATVIEVGLGQKLSGLDIRLPPRLADYVVRGFVTWPDGSAAAGVQVYLEEVNYPGWCVNGCEQKTDARGQFELRGFADTKYRVVSTANRIVAESKREEVFGLTDPFPLDGDLDGLKLVLSQPGRPWDDKKKEAEPAPGP
jgi:hypothetical protein